MTVNNSNNNRVILKFGGTSVSSLERLKTIESLIHKNHKLGLRPIIVCSALSQVSNQLEILIKESLVGNQDSILSKIETRHREFCRELKVNWGPFQNSHFEDLKNWTTGIKLLKEITPKLSAKIMAKGELLLTSIVSEWLKLQNINVYLLDARLKLKSKTSKQVDSHYLSAQVIPKINEEFIDEINALDPKTIVLTQGFIASDLNGDTVILGRGGSDTSASILGAILQVKHIEIWTDVPGMFTSNPQEIPSARLIKSLSYLEAQEMATNGAKVLHPACISPAYEFNIPIQICSTLNPEIEGTIINSKSSDIAQIKGISAKKNVTLISMNSFGMWAESGFLSQIFNVFRDEVVSIDLISTAQTNVTVSLDTNSQVITESSLNRLKDKLSKFCEVQIYTQTASISFVGNRVRSVLTQIGSSFELFEEHKIYLISQSATDLNFTVVVDESQVDRLVHKIHSKLFSDVHDKPFLGLSFEELNQKEPKNHSTLQKLEPFHPWWLDQTKKLLTLMQNQKNSYVYSKKILTERAQSILNLKHINQTFYSIKANSNPEILKLFYESGLNLECVSIEELRFVFKIIPSLNPNRILFTPNFCELNEYQEALDLKVNITVDNIFVLENIGSSFKNQSILLRIDPGTGKGHHKFVKTAGKESKFGIDRSEFEVAIKLCNENKINIIGLHVHLGSGILDPKAWFESAQFLAQLAKNIDSIQILNLGGGLGVNENPNSSNLNIKQVDDLLGHFKSLNPKFELWIEPGRFLVSEAGVLLSKVTQLKSKGEKHFIGLNVGMNSLIRPSLYGAYHQIYNLSQIDQPLKYLADIVGPICESGDVLGYQRLIPETRINDVFLICHVGAYGKAMASNYNLRTLPNEILI